MQDKTDTHTGFRGICRQWVYISGLILFVGVIVACHTDNSEIDRYESVLDLKIKKARAINGVMDKFQEELVLLREKFRRVEELLGDRPDDDSLVRLMSNLLDQSGLHAESIKTMPARRDSFYGEIPVVINLRGTYLQLVDFFEKLDKEFRLIPVSNLRINQSPNAILAQFEAGVIYGSGDLKTHSSHGFHRPTPSPQLLTNLSKERKARIQRKEKTVQELQPIIDQIMKYETDHDDLQEILTVIESLEEKQERYMMILNELNVRAPEQVWLTRLQATGNYINIWGCGLSQSTIEDFRTALISSAVFDSINVKITDLRTISGREAYEFELEFRYGSSNTDASYNSEGQRDLFVSLIGN